MTTSREAILASLQSLSAIGEVLSERLPAAGLLILRDGDLGDSDLTLSPVAYYSSTAPRSRL